MLVQLAVEGLGFVEVVYSDVVKGLAWTGVGVGVCHLTISSLILHFLQGTHIGIWVLMLHRLQPLFQMIILDL